MYTKKHICNVEVTPHLKRKLHILTKVFVKVSAPSKTQQMVAVIIYNYYYEKNHE
jgi:hypothetical protein